MNYQDGSNFDSGLSNIFLCFLIVLNKFLLPWPLSNSIRSNAVIGMPLKPIGTNGDQWRYRVTRVSCFSQFPLASRSFHRILLLPSYIRGGKCTDMNGEIPSFSCRTAHIFVLQAISELLKLRFHRELNHRPPTLPLIFAFQINRESLDS